MEMEIMILSTITQCYKENYIFSHMWNQVGKCTCKDVEGEKRGCIRKHNKECKYDENTLYTFMEM
jgi:hypothetical protein